MLVQDLERAVFRASREINQRRRGWLARPRRGENRQRARPAPDPLSLFFPAPTCRCPSKGPEGRERGRDVPTKLIVPLCPALPSPLTNQPLEVTHVTPTSCSSPHPSGPSSASSANPIASVEGE